MSDTDVFVNVLRAKIEELERYKSSIDAKIELLEELISGETGKPVKNKTTRRKTTRKKKVTVRKPTAEEDDLYQEAVAQLGDNVTTPEMQKRLAGRYRPQPRQQNSLGPGVRAGSKNYVLGNQGDTPRSDAQLSIEDD